MESITDAKKTIPPKEGIGAKCNFRLAGISNTPFSCAILISAGMAKKDSRNDNMTADII